METWLQWLIDAAGGEHRLILIQFGVVALLLLVLAFRFIKLLAWVTLGLLLATLAWAWQAGYLGALWRLALGQ